MIELRFGAIEFLDWGARTVFLDGCEALATFPTGADTLANDYASISHRLGYEYDHRRYCQEHELAHMIVEEVLHDRPSRVLWGLAHNAPLSGPEAAYEEGMAQTLQRFVRACERPLIGDVDWDRMRWMMVRSLTVEPA